MAGAKRRSQGYNGSTTYTLGDHAEQTPQNKRRSCRCQRELVDSFTDLANPAGGPRLGRL